MAEKYRSGQNQVSAHRSPDDTEDRITDQRVQVRQLECTLRQYAEALPYLTGRERYNILADLRLDIELYKRLASFCGKTQKEIGSIEQLVLPFLEEHQPKRSPSIQGQTVEEKTGVDFNRFVDGP